MSQEEQKYIFEIWFYGIFFETLFPTKCIICFLGPKGSGKSITLRKVGILMHGDKFNVSQLPNDQKDFLVTVANSYFVALDNVDSKSDWLEDSLATLATGGVVRSRKLYSDSTLVELELHAFIGITSRTPAFRRDDISERLLLMYLSRIDEFKPEHSLLNEVNLNRNEILTDVLLKLHEIIKGLVKYRDIDYKGKLRMADFASFAYKFAAIDNKVSFIESIFDKIAKNQSLFTLERDPIMDFLTIWLEDGNEGRFISYKDLCGELSLVAERTNEKFLYKNFRSFSQKMSHIRSNIEIFFDVEERSLGARNKVYSYRIKDKSSSVESEGGKSESNILF